MQVCLYRQESFQHLALKVQNFRDFADSFSSSVSDFQPLGICYHSDFHFTFNMLKKGFLILINNRYNPVGQKIPTVFEFISSSGKYLIVMLHQQNVVSISETEILRLHNCFCYKLSGLGKCENISDEYSAFACFLPAIYQRSIIRNGEKWIV